MLLLATATGLSVGNLYYAQPLLTVIGRTFRVDVTAAGGVVTAIDRPPLPAAARLNGPAAARPPAARSRVNSVYIATFFLGGAVGSQAGALAYHLGGWGAVCVTGAILPALSLAWWATERRPA